MSRSAPRVYLDHNATSPLRPEAREALLAAHDQTGGNPSSLHREGRAARAVVEQARERVARLAGVTAGEVVFTSGGSEAIVSAVRGVCGRAPGNLRRIVVSALEHSAVLQAAELAARHGFVVVRIPARPDGVVDVERFLVNIGPGVALAALQWANNETGVVQPLQEIGAACRAAGVPFFVDAVQAAGKLALEPRKAAVDLMALSGHKLGGPQGTGALIVREGIALEPLITGGAQEKRRRGGTQSVAALAGFGAAARAALEQMHEDTARLLRLRAKIETRLRRMCPEIRFHGESASRLPNTVNFAVAGLPGETLAIALDLAGFAVSTGSACASGSIQPSHVIRAMGNDEEAARDAVRISLGWSTTREDVDRFVEIVPGVIEQAREALAQASAPGEA